MEVFLLLELLVVVMFLVHLKITRLKEQLHQKERQISRLIDVTPEGVNIRSWRQGVWFVVEQKLQTYLVEGVWKPGKSAAKLYEHYKDMPAFGEVGIRWLNRWTSLLAEVAEEQQASSVVPTGDIEFDNEGGWSVKESSHG